MIPRKDVNPTRRPAVLTIGLIVACTLVGLFQTAKPDDLNRHIPGGQLGVQRRNIGVASGQHRNVSPVRHCTACPQPGDLVADPADLLRPGLEGCCAHLSWGRSVRGMQQSETSAAVAAWSGTVADHVAGLVLQRLA